MKHLGCLFLLFIICGCSNKLDIRYANSGDGCTYSELFEPRQRLLDYFGRRDSELYVNYAGVKCETIIAEELKEKVHKTPYNNINVVNEMPNLNIDIETEK